MESCNQKAMFLSLSRCLLQEYVPVDKRVDEYEECKEEEIKHDFDVWLFSKP
jgi:hypothetical protein